MHYSYCIGEIITANKSLHKNNLKITAKNYQTIYFIAYKFIYTIYLTILQGNS